MCNQPEIARDDVRLIAYEVARETMRRRGEVSVNDLDTYREVAREAVEKALLKAGIIRPDFSGGVIYPGEPGFDDEDGAEEPADEPAREGGES
jgi:hypothetical protein